MNFRSALTSVAAFAILSASLASCSPVASTALDTPASSETRSTASASPTPAVVQSVQPDPLIDLGCADLMPVREIGTLVGISEQDARSTIADQHDVVPIADIVRNAGGLACEFSDGGEWFRSSGNGDPINEAWRGAAIYILPNAAQALSELSYGDICGGKTSNAHVTVCQREFAAGSAWVTLAGSSDDRGETLRAVEKFVKNAVSTAAVSTGPIDRPAGTYDPGRDCESLVSRERVADILGEKSVELARGAEPQAISEATYFTEHLGCQWYRADSDNFVQAVVYPGGAWMSALSIPAMDGEAVTLNGMAVSDSAVSHCTVFSGYNQTSCYVEVVTDGTWMRVIGTAAKKATAMTIAVSTAEAIIAARL